MLPGDQGRNINGPSLIRAPEWLPGRLGTYYLYFGHHLGKFIRLAYADALEGPWRIYRPGTLQLADAGGCRDHIASPDVHVDDSGRQIVMYFHGFVAGGGDQRSFAARSLDGLLFHADPEPVADFYLRVARWRDGEIGMAKGGVMYLKRAGTLAFQELRHSAFPMSGPGANGSGDVRHVALVVDGDQLSIFFTRIGDAPERIVCSTIDLSQPIENWRASPPTEVIRPEEEWEGAGVPLIPSRSGAAVGPENSLRDPEIYREDGRTYLLYSTAGESGIAIAEILSADAAA